MPKPKNGSDGGFEHGLSRLRVRHSTADLPRSTKMLVFLNHSLNKLLLLRVTVLRTCVSPRE